jgi:hypothetical protein
MRRFIVALLGVSALSLLAPASVRAAAFIIDDTRADENILFAANDFEGGISVGGQPLQQGLNNPGTLLLPEADPTGQAMRWDFNGSWINPNISVPGPVQVAFLEPNTAGQSIISDILFCEYIPGTFSQISGFFISDATEGGLDPSQFVPGVAVIPWSETNGAFDFSAPFLTALANSDVEVPEPASFGLIAVGAGALILRRRASSRDACALSIRRRA